MGKFDSSLFKAQAFAVAEQATQQHLADTNTMPKPVPELLDYTKSNLPSHDTTTRGQMRF